MISFWNLFSNIQACQEACNVNKRLNLLLVLLQKLVRCKSDVSFLMQSVCGGGVEGVGGGG